MAEEYLRVGFQLHPRGAVLPCTIRVAKGGMIFFIWQILQKHITVVTLEAN